MAPWRCDAAYTRSLRVPLKQGIINSLCRGHDKGNHLAYIRCAYERAKRMRNSKAHKRGGAIFDPANPRAAASALLPHFEVASAGLEPSSLQRVGVISPHLTGDPEDSK